MSLWILAPVVSAAMIFNGLLAEWKDRQPGGFYNPTDDQIDRKK